MSVHGPETPMGSSRPEAIVPPQAGTPTTNQYSPDQSQYVPPLQSWPPQGQQVPQFSPVPYTQAPQHSVVLPWIFVAIGLVIPLSALIAGIWALTKVRERGSRYLAIGISGIGLFLVMLAIYVPKAMDDAKKEMKFSNGQTQPAPPSQPTPPATP